MSACSSVVTTAMAGGSAGPAGSSCVGQRRHCTASRTRGRPSHSVDKSTSAATASPRDLAASGSRAAMSTEPAALSISTSSAPADSEKSSAASPPLPPSASNKKTSGASSAHPPKSPSHFDCTSSQPSARLASKRIMSAPA
eukprot:scaffold172613_cov23-Tisochrysis_lutea.AAC.1